MCVYRGIDRIIVLLILKYGMNYNVSVFGIVELNKVMILKILFFFINIDIMIY